ncbi:MAG: M48 family metalloprotease [Armatimonadota bacterium]
MAAPSLARGLRVIVPLLTLSLLIAGCEENDIERRMGKVISKQVESAYTVVEDPLVADWVGEMGEATAANSRRDAERINVSFKVLETDLVNAFAVPWGHVYLTTGLLEAAESDDEVAGVVGHEWGHIVRRHSIRRFKKQLIWGTIAQVALAKQSDLTRGVGGLFLNLQFLKRSRKDELQADKEGVELSYRTGYDPQGEIDFFHTLREQRKRKPSNLELYFMTHPPLERRMARARALPELDSTNTEALVTIGNSYLARYRAAEAIGKFQQALLVDSTSFDAERGLADAYMLRGELDRAAGHYRAALQRRPGDEDVRIALAKADGANETALRPLRGEQRAVAQKAYAAAGEAIRSTAFARADVTARVTAAGKAAAPAQRNTISSLHTINGLYEGVATISDEASDLVTAVDQAVGRCNEAVYALEAMHVEMLDTADRASDVLHAARAALGEALDEGLPDPGRVAALTEAIREAETATRELQESAAAESKQLLPHVKNAGRVAENTASLVYGAFVGENDTSLQVIKDSLANAEARGKEATRRVRAHRKKAESARTRTLVAEIDVLTAGANPYQERMYDGLLGHYLRTGVDDVTDLRRSGYGYGDIALALAAATSTDAPENVGFIAEHGRGVTRSLVDYVSGEGLRLRNVNIMLKFAVSSLRRQTATQKATRIPAAG